MEELNKKWCQYYKSKKLYFALLTLLLIYFFVFHLPNNIADIFLINEGTVLLMLLLIVVPFFWIYFLLIILHIKPDIGVMITTFSILAALFFFIIQNFQENFSKLVILQHTTYLDCQNAELIASQDPTKIQYPWPHFNIDIYRQDIDFIEYNFPQSTLFSTQDDISVMDIANSEMDANELFFIQHDLNEVPQGVSMNDSLISAAKSIASTTCNILSPEILETTSNEYVNASFFSDLTSYIKNLYSLLFHN